MKTSIATVSISGGFAEKLAAIAGAGFDGIEIFEQDFIASDFTPAEVGTMVRDHGLTITLFQPFRDFEGLPEPLRSRAFARAARKFDLMNQLGTDLVLVCSSVHPAAMGASTVWRRIFTIWATWRPVMAFAWGSRRWLGAVMSTITATRGRWCAAPIMPISG